MGLLHSAKPSLAENYSQPDQISRDAEVIARAA